MPDASHDLRDVGEDVDAWRPRWLAVSNQGTYRLTRFVFLRFLGLIYTVGFAVACNQIVPLIGHDGLLPADQFLTRVKEVLGGQAVWRLPTLFWLSFSDAALLGVSYAGLVLSLVVLAGFANAIVLFLLWLFYLSIVPPGQALLGIRLGVAPARDRISRGLSRAAARSAPVPREGIAAARSIIWLLLVARVSADARRGSHQAARRRVLADSDVPRHPLRDAALAQSAEPVPAPASALGAEGERPFQPLRRARGAVSSFLPAALSAMAARCRSVVFQGLLIVSGNLSWLNWLTITIALACFDDRAWLRVCPSRFARQARTPRDDRTRCRKRAAPHGLWLRDRGRRAQLEPGLQHVLALAADEQLVRSALPRQHLRRVRQRGAQSATRSSSKEPNDDDPQTARWAAYEFRCKPGRLDRRPCVVAPYQYRIDWQMWFAAMSDYRHDPWVVHFVYKLLLGQPAILSLLA